MGLQFFGFRPIVGLAVPARIGVMTLSRRMTSAAIVWAPAGGTRYRREEGTVSMSCLARGCVRTQNHGWWGANGSGILLLL